MIKIKLPLPPSVNACYGTNFKTKKRFISRDYELWRKEAKRIWQEENRKIKISGDEWLRVEVFLFMPIYCKNGKKKVVDCMNYEKPLNDFLGWTIKNKWIDVEEFLIIDGFQDHKIIDFHISKIHYESDPYALIFFDEASEEYPKERLDGFIK